ncbi:MAG: hypothetical protein ACTSWL_01175 [Promethearchaeota archaeon]
MSKNYGKSVHILMNEKMIEQARQKGINIQRTVSTLFAEYLKKLCEMQEEFFENILN